MLFFLGEFYDSDDIMVGRRALTPGFKLMVLLGFEDWVGDPQPGVMLPQLGDQVVGHQAHRRRQSVQHDGHKRLQTKQGA